MARKGSHRSIELISRLVELGTSTLADQLGIPERQAKEAMHEITRKLADEYGGAYIYVPKDQEFALDQRDLRIVEQLDRGSLVEDVARDYGLTERQIYAVAKYARQHLVAKRQTHLPGFDQPPY